MDVLAPRFRSHLRLPPKRSLLKVLHWSILPFFIWFLWADPEVIRGWGPGWFRLHSINGLIFVTLSLLWTAWHLKSGLIGRAGPKLSPGLRVFHQFLHRVLIWGLFFVAFGGFMLGLTSHVLLKAGGFLPIAPPLGLRDANAWVGLFHTYQFYALSGVALLHAGFHIWRHIALRDNCLRIMAPKSLHRFL
ncbi:MAG: cytochrome B [Pseudomonadota bacterium]